MHLKDLKRQTPAELVAMAEELGVEGASTMRRQDLLFSILRELAEDATLEQVRAVRDPAAIYAILSESAAQAA